MKSFAIAALFGTAVLAAGIALAQDAPKPATPEKEHGWLKKLEGTWSYESEPIVLEPGKPPMKCKGTETVRSIGEFWSLSEMKGDFNGTPVTGIMTLGYDAQKKKYCGTWVCSMDGYMFKYEGTLDGDVLTLDTEGPNPATGKVCKMKDVIEIKDKDNKTLTSSIQGDDGKWTTFMTMKAVRK